MVRRGIPPFVREALERVVVFLWFAGIVLLLYLTLRSQLAQGTEPRADPHFVALCGGTVATDAEEPRAANATEPSMAAAAAPARRRPAP